MAREPFNSGPDDDVGDMAGSPAGHAQDAVQAKAGPCARTAGWPACDDRMRAWPVAEMTVNPT
jgi:hypothetical protein